MNSEGTSVKQKTLRTPWPSDVSSGPEGQLSRPLPCSCYTSVKSRLLAPQGLEQGFVQQTFNNSS